MVVEAVAPVVGGVAFEDGDQASALHIIGDRNAGGVEERFGEVEVGDDILVDRAGLGDAGPADEERGLEGLLVHPAFIEPAMLAQVPALVGGIDNNGVVGEARFIKVIEHTADVLIH